MVNGGQLLRLLVAGVAPFQQGGVSVPIVRGGWWSLCHRCRILRVLRPVRSLCLIGGVRERPWW